MEELSMTETVEPSKIKIIDRDLIKVFDKLNIKYFDKKLCAGIGWRKIKPGKNSTNVGLCNINERFIEISVILKDSRIPYWYVHYIVFHEMLHLVHGLGHSLKFVAHEKTYPDYLKSDKFHNERLHDIIDEWSDEYFT